MIRRAILHADLIEERADWSPAYRCCEQPPALAGIIAEEEGHLLEMERELASVDPSWSERLAPRGRVELFEHFDQRCAPRSALRWRRREPPGKLSVNSARSQMAEALARATATPCGSRAQAPSPAGRTARAACAAQRPMEHVVEGR